MPLDTRSKRASSVGLLLPWMLASVFPDGTLDQGDRQHGASSYSGILAAVQVEIIELSFSEDALLEPVAFSRERVRS